MSAITTPALSYSRQNRMRALCVAGGAAAAIIAWAVEVPLLGIRLAIRFGAMRPETVVAGQVVGAAIVASLLGWLLLAVLERSLSRSRAAWTGAAVTVLVVSLALPLAAATTTSAAVGLIAMHLAVAAAVIPGMSSTARRLGR